MGAYVLVLFFVLKFTGRVLFLEVIFILRLLKKENISMWLRFSVQLIMSILMFAFIYQQVNQSHLDFWFIIYFLFFTVVVLFWKPSENKK